MIVPIVKRKLYRCQELNLIVIINNIPIIETLKIVSLLHKNDV